MARTVPEAQPTSSRFSSSFLAVIAATKALCSRTEYVVLVDRG